jgi:tRNA (guanine37-N1)-methyltransferase
MLSKGMLFVKVPLAHAETVRAELMAAGLFDVTVSVERDSGFTYLPITAAIKGYELVEREGKVFRQPRTLREALAEELTEAELEALTGSYDVVGNIAILDIDEELAAKEQLIAQAIFATHKHVTTVLKKAEKHGGEFRTQGLAYVAGEDTRETLVKESGTQLLVDVEQVYFSVRLSTERLRIASQVKPGEHILVLFSGAAPYVVVLSKHTKAAHIVGVEKNPVGHQYGLENLKRNKIKNAALFNEDAANLPFLKEQFDRIIMPHPSGVLDFLPAALSVAKEKAILHIYIFGSEEQKEEIFDNIQRICSENNFEAHQFVVVRAGHHAPYVYRWCFDVEVRRAQ